VVFAPVVVAGSWWVALSLAGAGFFAAAFVCSSTFPKIAVKPSLTFLPAAPAAVPPAAAAPTSVMVWAQAAPATANANTR
jgi:hypothetical protein